MHPRLTPLAQDVDFHRLAGMFDASGGDIRNAVLKAALAAASEPGSSGSRAIRQGHFEEAMRDVMDGKQVMRQTVADRIVPPAGSPFSVVIDRRLIALLVLSAVLNSMAVIVAVTVLLIAVL
jgi:hypothetical protein